MAQDRAEAVRRRSARSRSGRARGVLAVAAIVALRTAAAADAARTPDCAVPGGLLSVQIGALRSGAPVRQDTGLRVLLVGLASTDELRARLSAEIARRLPAIEVAFRYDGTAGELAAAALDRLKREVVDWSPNLVVWSVGTNDAVARTDAQDFAATIRDGIDWILQRGVGLVLVDPPFFPGVGHEASYQAYAAGIEEAANAQGVPVLRRYEAMQHWAARADARPDPSGDGHAALEDASQACIAKALGTAIAEQAGAR